MIKNKPKNKNLTEHCCNFMTKSLIDCRIGINYSSVDRDYTIYFLFSNMQQRIEYCPFCGSQLPKSLVNEYKNILKKEYGIEDPYDEEVFEKLPEEFKTDEWWEKRGL